MTVTTRAAKFSDLWPSYAATVVAPLIVMRATKADVLEDLFKRYPQHFNADAVKAKIDALRAEGK